MFESYNLLIVLLVYIMQSITISNTFPALKKNQTRTYFDDFKIDVSNKSYYQSDKDSPFHMPHLYSGDLDNIGDDHLHEVEETTRPYEFDKEMKKTDKFIPYTYVIELSNTYEEEHVPSSQRVKRTDGVLPYVPRLMSDEVKKKTETFVEQAYDRGAYDHKGYEDHESKVHKYSELEKGNYGETSSSSKHEGEHFNEIIPDTEHISRADMRAAPSKPFFIPLQMKERLTPCPNDILPSFFNFWQNKVQDCRNKKRHAILLPINNVHIRRSGSSRSSFMPKNPPSNLFQFPSQSKYYDNFASKHTIPAFKAHAKEKKLSQNKSKRRNVSSGTNNKRSIGVGRRDASGRY